MHWSMFCSRCHPHIESTSLHEMVLVLFLYEKNHFVRIFSHFDALTFFDIWHALEEVTLIQNGNLSKNENYGKWSSAVAPSTDNNSTWVKIGGRFNCVFRLVHTHSIIICIQRIAKPSMKLFHSGKVNFFYFGSFNNKNKTLPVTWSM